jgi:choline dehydrogenase-like flavoprotein
MQAYLAAAQEADHRLNEDFNGPSQDGVGFFQVTQRNGLRCSSAAAFLRPALDRPNLEVITDAQVTRLLLEGIRAVGVEYERAGTLSQVRADREVLLAAGAYNSPQLLLLSGIGPAAELRAYGITPVIDLPVGENLQDHPLLLLAYLTDTESLLTAGSPQNLAALQRAGRGPLTSNLAEAGGFLRTVDGLPAPDVQLHAAPVMFIDEGLGRPTDHAYVIGAVVLKPTSRGKVFLRSLLPTAKPHIVHGYLTSDEDRATMVRAVRAVARIAEQPSMKRHERAPLRVPASDSDADILEFARRELQTIYHPVGTCAIGPVVDPQLRVHGIDGLRVIDASVMPTIVRGNTNAPTIMIAERAADFIKAGD